MNHPQISAILDDEEEECLHYLTTVRIKVGQECSYVLSVSIIHDIINDFRILEVYSISIINCRCTFCKLIYVW